MQIQGQVQAAAGNGTGIKVNEQWYNIPPGTQQPQRGSTVSFFAVPDPGGRGTLAQNLQVTAAPQQGQGGQRGGQYRRSGGGNQRTPRDIYGPIVGHNLLIAATLLGPGHSVQDAIAMARQLMQASDQLLQETIAGQGQPQAQAQPAPQQQMQPQAQQQQNNPQAPAQGAQFGYQQPAQQGYPPPQAQNNVAPQQAPVYDNLDDDIPW